MLGNVAPGTLTAASLEAVNGEQLDATNQAVGTNTTAIAGLDMRLGATNAGLATLDAVAVRYDAIDRAGVSFGGAGGTVLDNVAPGALTAGSAQAVNGAQLFATNTLVAATAAAIAGLSTSGRAGPLFDGGRRHPMAAG